MAQSVLETQVGPAYIPVSAATLIPEAIHGLSLYLPGDVGDEMQLYRSPDVPLTEADLKNLISRGHTRLFVRADEHADYQQYLRDSLQTILVDESLPVPHQFGALDGVARDVLAHSFAAGKTDQTVDTSRDLAQKTVELICRKDVTETDLMGIMRHDYYTFTHSANVSYYCVMLANALQICDSDGLVDIAAAALLHDVGKLEIPDTILCKPGRLSDAEFAAIRRHPTTGFRMLCHRKDLSYAQMMMVYQHHERLDGKGYPVGVIAEEIHDWARVCTVADVFEALTSNRPYRAGMSRERAFEIMDRDRGLAFDEDILECWKITTLQI